MYLAVYGSLMRAEGMLARLGVEPWLRFAGPARIPGRLFDLGEFPGLTILQDSDGLGTAPGEPAKPAPWVPGELFEILSPAVLPILDAYEGAELAAPGEGRFVRRQLDLAEPAVEAWVYLYRGTTDGCAPVTDSSWPDYKARRDRQEDV